MKYFVPSAALKDETHFLILFYVLDLHSNIFSFKISTYRNFLEARELIWMEAYFQVA